MSLSTTLLLGLIAGGTIVLGLPVGRLRRPRTRLKLFLNAVAIGLLLFLVWDVLSGAWEPIDTALSAVHVGIGGIARVLGYGALFAAGLAFRPLLPIDETRYLSVSWEMLLRGSYLVPTMNFEPYFQKPPMLFWLIDIAWAIVGVSRWSALLVVFAASAAAFEAGISPASESSSRSMSAGPSCLACGGPTQTTISPFGAPASA